MGLKSYSLVLLFLTSYSPFPCTYIIPFLCLCSRIYIYKKRTDFYINPLKTFSATSIKHYITSPLESARKRKEGIHSKKTDKLDPIAISKVYYDREELWLHEVEDDRFHCMKQLNRLYEDKIDHLRKYKVAFRNSLSICFPGFLELFNDGYSGIAMLILKKYPHPDLIKNKQPETIARYIEKHTCHKKAVSMKYAVKIIEFANKIYPGCERDDIEVKILQDLLEKVEMARKDADETLKGECEELCVSKNRQV
ncbi:IS110 family transposase [[Clostridium] innocuum]|uniref:IS110 family transposase n=2 Tax=Clostridium innocuum TaxID=1522 RepID=UPI0022E46BC8|nr:transposase [[Clostridium] innocuum]